MKVFLIICASITLMISAKNEEYCDINCHGFDHIACNNSGRYSEKCDPMAQLVELEFELQEKLLELHNELRENVASGNLTNFNSASHMGAVSWDDELSKLAELNVKKCDMKHDKCRSTNHFKFAGQCVASWIGQASKTAEEAIDYGFQLWFRQHKDATMVNINGRREYGKHIGDFLILVNERNNKVGCAVLLTPRWGLNSYTIACNYPVTNIQGEVVYESGIPTHKCITGADRTYRNLCSTSEEYDV